MRQIYFDELKKCVCGGTPQIEKANGTFFVTCKDCGCSGAAYPYETQAANSWNKKIKMLKAGKK